MDPEGGSDATDQGLNVWPKGFERIANHFLMSPKQLAYLLCADFAYNPPKRLVVIETPKENRD